MLVKTIPATEGWDEASDMFVSTPEITLTLEHSLISVSKWESKWKKPFLTSDNKNEQELRDYISCMTISPTNVDPKVYLTMPVNIVNEIYKYVNDNMTATHVVTNKKGRRQTSEQPTSELIYYWMIQCGIPFECQKWHLSRLLKLIEVCNAKSEPPPKMSQSSILKQNAALNAARRKKYNTKG